MARGTVPGHWRASLGRVRGKIFALMDRLIGRLCFVSPRRGVAIMMPHGLGDLIIFTAAYRHLEAHYAGRPLLLICSAACVGYAEAYLGPHHIIVLHRTRFRRDPWYRIRIVRAMARAGISVIIQPARNREHMVEDALVSASGAVERIGAAGTPFFISDAERAVGDRAYTKLYDERSCTPHDAEYYAAFVTWITGRRPSRMIAPLMRPPRPRDAPDGDYLVIASEASSIVKAWPVERFLVAAATISTLNGLMIVLAGQNRQDKTSSAAAVLDLRGSSDIRGLTALLAHARLVLCNDSGPAHLAAVLGVPVVAVGNGGMPGRYLPYPANEPGIFGPHLVLPDPPLPCFGCGWRCKYLPLEAEPVPCIAEVTIAAVVTAALSIQPAHQDN